MTDYEEDMKEQIRRLKKQFESMNPMNAQAEKIIERQNTEQGLLKENDVVIEGSAQNIDLSTLKSGPEPTPAATPGACDQCGTIHPPIQPGSKCPNAEVKIVSEKDNKEVNVNKYLTSLRDIVVSQISIKKIQDPNKLFQNITIEVTKYLEGYKE